MQLTNARATLFLKMACDTGNPRDFMTTLHHILKDDNLNEIMPSFVAEAAMVLFTTIDTDKIVPYGRRFAHVLSMLDHWTAMPAEMWQTTFKEYAQLVVELVNASKRRGIEVNENAEDALICLGGMMDVIEGKLHKSS